METPGAYETVTESPIGFLRIRLSREGVARIAFVEEPPEESVEPPAAFSRVLEQLERYFESGDFRFSLALELSGTPFQRRVWEALGGIPPGEVRTYGEIAARLESSPRAVGGACRLNPVPVVVPCHRVVSAAGIGGYAGETSGRLLRIKGWLLDHERGAR